jgi:phospholipase/carboxylesterase
MKPNLKNIAGIECLCIEKENAKRSIVLFHGYGANMHDLFPLWEIWDQSDINWYFPNGILALPMGYYEGRAWFSIDMQALEQAMRLGEFRDMAGSIPPEFDMTLAQQENFLKEISKKDMKLIIGGFSQGAMCASHLAMKKDVSVDGLILLSGCVLAQSKYPHHAKPVPFYQSHGNKDPILPLAGAKMLEEKLIAMDFNGSLHEFNGGHEIPPEVVNQVKKFISSLS